MATGVGLVSALLPIERPTDPRPPTVAEASRPPPNLTAVARPARAQPAPGRRTHLAIPDYDSLSASQVMPRLEGLNADELEAVRTYEASTRGRRTILNKIAQLS